MYFQNWTSGLTLLGQDVETNFDEDRVYFWWKAGKAILEISPGKPEKIQKIWLETGKCPFGVTES